MSVSNDLVIIGMEPLLLRCYSVSNAMFMSLKLKYFQSCPSYQEK